MRIEDGGRRRGVLVDRAGPSARILSEHNGVVILAAVLHPHEVDDCLARLNGFEVTEVVRLIEQAVGKRAIRELAPMQPGDVPETCADVDELQQAVGFAPRTPVADGILRFTEWYRGYRKI